jgi:S1-C subfamily serine protease
MAGSPAAQAGLQQGDVILSYNKIPVEDYRHVQRMVAETGVGRTITLEVLRKKQRIQVSLTIADVPDSTPRRTTGQPQQKG